MNLRCHLPRVLWFTLAGSATAIGQAQPAPAPAAKPTPAATERPAQPQLAPAPIDPAKPLVPFPHPLITEVLFAVPTGEAGDANKDGTRQVAGDEFVELVNPHAKPINLGGYTLSDMTASEKAANGKPKSGALRWTFPAVTLKPGQVAVVFNGHASTITPPVGTSAGAPEKPSPVFADALVFSMRQPTDRVAFANTADWVLLTGPDGRPVHLIKWGEPRIKPPADVPLIEDAPSPRAGSAQRIAVGGPLLTHPSDGSVSFSPGRFELPATQAREPDTKPVDPPAPPAEQPPTPDAPADPAKPATKPRF